MVGKRRRSSLALLPLMLLCTRAATAQTLVVGGTGGAAKMFEKQCYSCHNIGGGDKKGPDLMNLLKRRDRAWLQRFIPSATTLKNAGDPNAVKLFSKYAPEEMTDQMLSPEQIDQILALIDDYSKKKKTFVPTSGRLSRRPLPRDIPAGRRLFTGQTRLAHGGPSCMACHSVAGVGYLGGGALGPDLTDANRRYTEVELASILKAPAFPTMSKLFANHALSDEEVVKLFAYLHSVRTRTADAPRAASHYLIGAAAGVLAIFGLMGFTWRGRMHRERWELKRSER
jgi:mono/diheme cytochrome c family protein